MFSRFHKILKIAAALAVLLVAAGIGAPYFGADYFQSRIERALESALGRKVSIGKTHYSLFTGPGFTIDEVIVAEDPRIGIEPFAFVQEVDARIDWWSVFSGVMEFSSLRLVEPNINLARADDGTWNVQVFLDRAPAKTLPPITIRTGQIHFKSGDRKATIYLGDTDADINHSSDGRVRLAATGEAYRSDRQSEGLGRLALRGNYMPDANAANPGKIDLDFELERSEVQDLVKLFNGRDLGLKGFVEVQAHLAGPIDHVGLRGQFKTSELAGRLFLPTGGPGPLPFEGTINFNGAQAVLASSGGEASPIALKFTASNFLRDPDWNAELKLKDLAVPAALEIAKNFGLALPSGVDVQGKLQGALRFNRSDGAEGDFELGDPVIQLPGGGKIENALLKFEVHGNGVALLLHGPADEHPVEPRANPTAGAHLPVRPAPPGPFDFEGSYDLDSKTVALGISSRGARISETRKMLGPLPLLEHFADGVWRGTLKYLVPTDGEAVWQGQIDVSGAQVEIPGIAGAVTLAFRAQIEGSRAVVRSFNGNVGTIAFTGNYRYEPAAPRPHRLNLVVPTASLSDIEKILTPTLQRSGGLLARTLRFGRVPVPDWLHDRRLEGTIGFGELQMGDWVWKSAQAQLQWTGTIVRLTNILGSIDEATVSGEGVADLSGSSPAYTASGVIGEIEYRGGQLALKGKVTSRGSADQLVENAKAEGTFEASAIRFAAENLFDHASGAFELAFPGALPKTKLTNLEVSQGSETYQGQGGTQTDGRLVLDLASGPKQVKWVGTLLAPPTVQ